MVLPRLLSVRALTLGLLAAAALTGCEDVPKGHDGGRVDPYKSTEADRHSGRANIPALLEFTDRVAEQLAQDLCEIDEVQKAPTKLVLEMGTIKNDTQTPTTDFELIRSRLQSQIFKSKIIRRQFLFVESRSRMNEEMRRVEGEDATGKDLLQEGGAAQPGSDRYDPKITYVLQGDFHEANRSGGGGERRQFFFRFKLVNLASRQMVFQGDFDLAQR